MADARSAAFRASIAAAIVVAALGLAGNASAGSKKSKDTAVASKPPAASYYNIGSLASEFLQSKTQIQVLDHEDVMAPSCQTRHFVKADVVKQPVLNPVGHGVNERKWTEQWTLDRCGTQVSYWVFFTEVGQGGAYVSIVDPNAKGGQVSF